MSRISWNNSRMLSKNMKMYLVNNSSRTAAHMTSSFRDSENNVEANF